jgi:hypothetical protein
VLELGEDRFSDRGLDRAINLIRPIAPPCLRSIRALWKSPSADSCESLSSAARDPLSLKVQVVTFHPSGMTSAPVLLKHQGRILKVWKDSIWGFIEGHPQWVPLPREGNDDDSSR